jgi:hypothetical protein
MATPFGRSKFHLMKMCDNFGMGSLNKKVKRSGGGWGGGVCGIQKGCEEVGDVLDSLFGENVAVTMTGPAPYAPQPGRTDRDMNCKSHVLCN